MSLVFSPGVSPRQTPMQATIDRSHPIARGLAVAMLPFGNSYRDIIGSSPAPILNNARTVGGTLGACLEGTSGPSWWNYGSVHEYPRITISTLSRFSRADAVENGSPVYIHANGGNGLTGLDIHGGSFRFADFYLLHGADPGTQFIFQEDITSQWDYVTPLHQVLTCDGTEVRCYLNGRLLTSASCGAPFYRAADKGWQIFNTAFNAPSGVNKKLYHAYLWRRALSAAEVKYLFLNPYEFVQGRAPVWEKQRWMYQQSGGPQLWAQAWM